MDDRDIARWRVHTLRLAGQSYSSPEAVVDGLLAVQAENFAQASWAVATRTPGMTQREFLGLFDAGAVLRTHVLRPTWHFVRPDDIRWLVELTAPRVRRTFDRLKRSLGIDGGVLEASRVVLADALAGGVALTREDLGERLREAGLPVEGQRLGVLMADAELSALVCSGPPEGRANTYALLAERAPGARQLDRAEALGEIVLRYVGGHGPATERDLSYWASLTITDVGMGLAAVRDELDHVTYDGRVFWFREPPPGGGAPLEPRAHLLQVLDEYHNGYQDSRGVLDADGIVPRGRAATVGMVLVDGQMVGGMRRTLGTDGVTFEVDLFRDLAEDESAALHEAAERYGSYLESPARLTVRRAHRPATS